MVEAQKVATETLEKMGKFDELPAVSNAPQDKEAVENLARESLERAGLNYAELQGKK